MFKLGRIIKIGGGAGDCFLFQEETFLQWGRKKKPFHVYVTALHCINANREQLCMYFAWLKINSNFSKELQEFFWESVPVATSQDPCGIPKTSTGKANRYHF